MRAEYSRRRGQCKLCKQMASLCRSHIVPEFFFRRLYDEQHRCHELTIPSGKTSLLQKGLRERLLCKRCEARLSRYEKCFSQRIYPNIDSQAFTITDNPTICVDYMPFKLFVLSLFWRLSVTSRTEFVETPLGDAEGRIRKMILTESPGGRNEYPPFIVKSLSKDDILHQVIMPLGVAEIAGMKYACAALPSILLCMCISSNSEHSNMSHFFLQEDGTIALHIQNDWFIDIMKSAILGAQQRQF